MQQQGQQHEMANKKSKVRGLVIRMMAALVMISVLLLTVFKGGHIGVCILLLTSACGLFREIVNVAHSEANAEKEIPWFRSVLYVWFLVAMFAAYTSDKLKAPMQFTFILRSCKYIPSMISQPLAMFLEIPNRYHNFICLWLYALSFVGTVLCLRLKYLATQLRILSFTVLGLSLFIIPIKLTIYNTFTGLFWFLLPLLLVATNDSFAYFCGYCFGKKLINKPFISLSPTKTWEGFIGGGIVTLIAGYYLPLLLNTKWLTCSYEQIQLLETHEIDQCVPSHVFMTRSERDSLMISSSSSHDNNDHLNLLSQLDQFTGFYPQFEVQYHGLFLAFFASTIAPFGGFAASAIKRAYGIKDFSSLIPGHGGFMDRLDCQFLMALATYVHLKTFILVEQLDDTVTAGGGGGLISAHDNEESSLQAQVLYLISQMSESERASMIEQVGLF